jgi:hypothetical protein
MRMLELCKLKDMFRGTEFWISAKESCQLDRTKMVVIKSTTKSTENVTVAFVANKKEVFNYPADFKVMKICE